MQYRLAETHDAGLVSGLMIAAWQDAYQSFLPESLLASLHQNPFHDQRSWERRIAQPGTATWLTLDQAGAVVGVVRISFETPSVVPDSDCELTTLYLLTRARGRGLGSMALSYAEEAASRQGASALGLLVLSGNTRGQKFYEHHRACRVGDRIAFRWGGRPIVEVMYRLRLGD